MHTVEEALQIISKNTQPLAPEPLSLSAALGHVLAQDIIMRGDSPPFDRAVVDGFALRSADAGPRYKLVGHVDAGGAAYADTLAAGECVQINTGALLPAGADAVVMVEETRAQGEWINIAKPLAPGAGIQRRGADARDGQTILKAGIRLGPAQLAACASAGFGEVPVRIVRSALLVTGDELVAPEYPGPLHPGHIRNSNTPMLAALLQLARCTLLDLGVGRDHKETLSEIVTKGLAQSDLLVICGGMSMGTRDCIPQVLQELGVQFHVEKVRMKPGKPFLFGTCQHGGKTRTIAGLPGNPVSAFVCFCRFVKAMIAHFEGTPQGAALVQATLASALPANGDREFYVPGKMTDNGHVEALPWKGSGDIFTLAQAEALIVRSAAAPTAAVGEPVSIVPLRAIL